MRHALWPESSVEEHSRELEAMLAGKQPWNDSRGGSGRRKRIELWLVSSKSACVPTRTAATSGLPWATSKAGTYRRSTAGKASGRSYWPRRKIGLEPRDASKWRRTRNGTIICRNASMRRWDSRSPSVPSSSGKSFEFGRKSLISQRLGWIQPSRPIRRENPEYQAHH